VLRTSERFAMSDVIAHKDLNEATRADMVSYTGCIADVLSEAEFPRRALAAARLTDIEIRETHAFTTRPPRPSSTRGSRDRLPGAWLG
jgi:hypothetical protein